MTHEEKRQHVAKVVRENSQIVLDLLDLLKRDSFEGVVTTEHLVRLKEIAVELNELWEELDK